MCIVDLALEVTFSPYLLARYMIEEMSTFRGKMLSEAMRDPEGMLGNIDSIKDEFRATEQDGTIWYVLEALMSQ